MGGTTLKSGIEVNLDPKPLLRFSKEEWAYYDGIIDREPNSIIPEDVLVTVAVNSRVDNADRVRAVHRGMARACDGLLPEIPVDADIRTFDLDGSVAKELLAAACGVKFVAMAVATKILHRKRRSWIPMLDSVVNVAYLDALACRFVGLELNDAYSRHAKVVNHRRMMRHNERCSCCRIEDIGANDRHVRFPGYPQDILGWHSRLIHTKVYREVSHSFQGRQVTQQSELLPMVGPGSYVAYVEHKSRALPGLLLEEAAYPGYATPARRIAVAWCFGRLEQAVNVVREEQAYLRRRRARSLPWLGQQIPRPEPKRNTGYCRQDTCHPAQSPVERPEAWPLRTFVLEFLFPIPKRHKNIPITGRISESGRTSASWR